MHISLDSALGRQRRLNSVGESVFQIAPDAAAGYSLRSLTGGDPSVVRVRRESDNGERDFRSSEINSGSMVRWVNEQITPPLDLRELTATGRDGPIIEAAAAYSLRNLSDSYAGNVVEVRRNTDGALKDFKASEVTDGTLAAWVNTSFANALPLDTAGAAAAAYSLRNLSSSYTGSVVEVRRSSDGTLRSFTAAEVTDGTLVAWVNEDVVKYSSDFSSSLDGFSVDSGDTALAGQTFEGESDVLKHTPSGSQSSAHRIRRLSIIPSSSIVSLKVLVYIPSSNTVVNGAQIRNVAADVFAGTNTTDEWVEVEATGTSGSVGSSTTLAIHATSGGTRTFTGNGTDAIYYKNVSVTVTAADGTVSKWYDQSGNDNHATQGTPASQPKIVSGGSLVTGGLAFDGVSDTLFVSGNPVITANSTGTYSTFSVQNTTTTASGYLFGNASPTDGSSLLSKADSTFIVSDAYHSKAYISRSSGENLLSSVYNNNDVEMKVNGAGTTIDGVAYTFPAGTSDFRIGSRNPSNVFVGGTISEVIVYNSDQSDKRRAIEENIGSTYGITLTSSKDGTVSKWYDQSTTSGVPNANHLVNSDPAKQPRIVINGELYVSGIQIPSTSFLNSQSSFTGFVLNDISSIVLGQASGGAGVGALTLFDGSNNFANPYRYSSTQGYRYSNESVGPQPNSGAVKIFTLIGSPTIAEGFSNGTSYRTSTVSSAYVGTRKFRIGGNGTSGISGSIKEVILYNSDQTDNRTALEANIGEVYGIAGIPAYDDTVNGFVETWYDQSGNGNNATQSTAGSQPKIVDAGVYLGEVDFLSGTNTFLGTTNSDLCNVAELSVFSVLKPHLADSQVVAFSCGSVVSGSTAYGGWRLNLNGYLNQAQFQTQTIGNASMTGVNNGVGGNDTLVSYVANFPDAATFANGQAGGSTSSAISPSNNNIFKRRFRIGCQYTHQAAAFYTKPIKELILYTSDQSANRPAIEANINNQYDIY